MAKKIATTVYITEEQQTLLKELNRRSKVPIAEFIREGIDLVLKRHQHVLPGQIELRTWLLRASMDQSGQASAADTEGK